MPALAKKSSLYNEERFYILWSHPSWKNSLLLELEEDPTDHLKNRSDASSLRFSFQKMKASDYDRIGEIDTKK